MEDHSNHIIQHTKLDFHFNGSTDGFELQQETYNWFEQLIKQIEPQLRSLTEENEYYSINELVLDADVNGENWKDEAMAKILRQLKDKIQLTKRGIINPVGYRLHTTQHHFENVFIYYLQYGFLPWNVNQYTTEQWNEQLAKMISNSNHQFLQKLIKVLKQYPQSIIRLTEHISFRAIAKLFIIHESFFSEDQQQILYDTVALEKQIGKAGSKSHREQLLYRYFLTALVADDEQLLSGENSFQLLNESLKHTPGWEKIIAEVSFRSTSFKLLQNTSKKDEVRIDENVIRNLVKMQEQEFIQYQINETTEAIYISNAGLVIIAAFLPAFFERTKLVVVNELTDVDKAVCLLHYISTGNIVMREFDLVLPKILCGLPVDYPVSVKKFRVNKLLKKEVEEMLTSVIEYWNILQNTSVEGLRESFLKRKGKLSFENNEWHLHAEQQPYDMLLQHLPWNISMIQLPWMKQMLKTEWIY